MLTYNNTCVHRDWVSGTMPTAIDMVHGDCGSGTMPTAIDMVHEGYGSVANNTLCSHQTSPSLIGGPYDRMRANEILPQLSVHDPCKPQNMSAPWLQGL